MNVKNFKIKTQLRIGLGVLFFFVIVLGGFTYLKNDEIRKQNEILYTYPLQVTRTLGILNGDILNIRLGLKDLLLVASDQKKLTAVQLMKLSDADALEQFNYLNELYLDPRKHRTGNPEKTAKRSQSTQNKLFIKHEPRTSHPA